MRITSRCWKLKRARDLGQSRLFGFAHPHASKAKKSTLLGCFSDMLADLSQPMFKGSGIARCLRVDYRCSLPQRFDAFVLDLGWLAALEFVFQTVAGPSVVPKSLTTALISASV